METRTVVIGRRQSPTELQQLQLYGNQALMSLSIYIYFWLHAETTNNKIVKIFIFEYITTEIFNIKNIQLYL